MADGSYVTQTPQVAQDGASVFNGSLAQILDTLLTADTSIPECDKLFRELPHGEKVDRYSTAFVRFTAGQGAGADLLLAPSSNDEGTGVCPALVPTYEFFHTGLNDTSSNGGDGSHLYSDPPPVGGLIPGEGSPFTLSQADTDGYRVTTTNVVGANLTVDERVDFYAAGVMISFAGVYTAESVPQGPDGITARRSPAFVDRVAGAYLRRLLRLCMRHLSLRIQRQGKTFSRQVLDYRLGPIGDYPAYNEFYGDGAISSGTPVPFAFKQIPLPILTGRSPKLVNQNRFRFFLDGDSRFIVQNDSTNLVPGSLSSVALLPVFANSLFIGIRLHLIGGMICIGPDGRPSRKVMGNEGAQLIRDFNALPLEKQAEILGNTLNGKPGA